MNSTKIDPKYIIKSNPRIGLIALASDFMIERDFINVIKDRDIDFFVNRIECYNPLTKENLIKMSDKVTEVTKDILPDQDIDCIVYGCTSGTIAAYSTLTGLSPVDTTGPVSYTHLTLPTKRIV